MTAERRCRLRRVVCLSGASFRDAGVPRRQLDAAPLCEIISSLVFFLQRVLHLHDNRASQNRSFYFGRRRRRRRRWCAPWPGPCPKVCAPPAGRSTPAAAAMLGRPPRTGGIFSRSVAADGDWRSGATLMGPAWPLAGRVNDHRRPRRRRARKKKNR